MPPGCQRQEGVCSVRLPEAGGYWVLGCQRQESLSLDLPGAVEPPTCSRRTRARSGPPPPSGRCPRQLRIRPPGPLVQRPQGVESHAKDPSTWSSVNNSTRGQRARTGGQTTSSVLFTDPFTPFATTRSVQYTSLTLSVQPRASARAPSRPRIRQRAPTPSPQRQCPLVTLQAEAQEGGTFETGTQVLRV